MEENKKRITVSLSEECYEALRRYAFDADVSLSSAARCLCEESLAMHRYGIIKGKSFERLGKN